MMNNQEHFETLTEGYMISYNKAMEITHNPDFAVQVAMAVIVAESMKPQPQNNRIDPFTLLFTAAQMESQKKKDAPKRSETAKKRNEPPEKRNADTENKD